MSIFSKFRKEILILSLLVLFYFALRLPNLTLQPIFADEAIYIRWAQVMQAEPTLRFLPLSDGKTPLFMWSLIPLFKLIEDPLLAGRLLSVFSGFFTLIGAIFLGWKFFNKKIGLFSGLLVVITPMLVFFDRMALVDSMLAAFFIWSLIFSMLLVKYLRLDLAILLGYFLGGGLLTKSPGFFSILTLPVTILLFNFSSKKRQGRILKLFGLWVVAIATALMIYNILRLGPGFDNLNSRNQDYTFSPAEVLLEHPLDPLIPHFNDLVDWLPKMITLPILILILCGIASSVYKRNKEAGVLLAWSITPLFIEMLFLKTFTARYILFVFPPLLVVAAWGFTSIFDLVKYKFWIKFLVFLILTLPFALIFNYHLLTDPTKANLPKEERQGYLIDWTAGYGLKEIALYLSDYAKTSGKKVIVGTEGSFGTLQEGLQIYLDKNRQVVIIGGTGVISDQLYNSAKENPTFYLANRNKNAIPTQGLKVVKQYLKLKGFKGEENALTLYQLPPTN